MHGGQRVTEVRRRDARAHARAAEAERVRVESGGADDRRQRSLARTRTHEPRMQRPALRAALRSE
jgi:hypothetical protein